MTRLLGVSKSRAISVFFVLIAVFSGAFYYVNVREQKEQVDCQTQYNRAFSENILIRARLNDQTNKLNDQKDQAYESLLSGISALMIESSALPEDEEDSSERKALRQRYLNLFKAYNTNIESIKETSAEVQKTRSENPPPAIPNC